MEVFTYFNDPGHAWIRVPRSLLSELEIANKISSYSFQKGDQVYLECHRDAMLFQNAMERKGRAFRTIERYAKNRSTVRNYNSYKVD